MSSRDFNGSTSTITATVNPINTESWSVVAWFNMDGTGEGGFGRILEIGNSQKVFIGGANQVRISQNGSSPTDYLSNAVFTNSVWWCIVAVYDAVANACRLYYGGEYDSMREDTGGTVLTGSGRTTNVTDCAIGNVTAETRSFDGRLCHVGIVPWAMDVLDAERFRKGDITVCWKYGTPRIYVPMQDPVDLVDISRDIVVHTPAFVRHCNTSAITTAVTSRTLTVPAAGHAAGNILVVRVTGNNALGTVTVTDTQSNPYTPVHISTADPDMTVLVGQINTALVSGNSVTASFSSTDRVAMSADEFSGTSTTELVASVAGGPGPSASPSSGASSTPGEAIALVLGQVAFNGPTSDTFTQDSDTTGGPAWSSITTAGTTGGSAGSNVTLEGGYKVTTSAAAQTYNPTNSASRDYSCILVILERKRANVALTTANTTLHDSGPIAWSPKWHWGGAGR